MGERIAYVSELFKSSEMYCSLRYEDYRGCPYNKFTPRGIATLAVVCYAFAALSLVLGA